MSWAIAVSNRARKSLKRVPAADQARIMAALSVMQSDPLSGDVVKLASQDAFRRRVGNYRIIFGSTSRPWRSASSIFSAEQRRCTGSTPLTPIPHPPPPASASPPRSARRRRGHSARPERTQNGAQGFTPRLPMDDAEFRDGHNERPLHPPRPHIRSNSCRPEIAGIRFCVSPRLCMEKRRSAPSLLQCARRDGLPLPDCLQQCAQKFLRDRQGRRVHIEASYAAIATEYLLHLLIGRQVSSDRTLFDDLPFFIGDVVAPEPLLDLSRETRDLLLIVRRPGEHPIQHLFDLFSRHHHTIP